jgi:hypothetical protein
VRLRFRNLAPSFHWCNFFVFSSFKIPLVWLCFFSQFSLHACDFVVLFLTFHSLFVTLDDFNHFPLLMGFTMKTHFSFSPYSLLINVFSRGPFDVQLDLAIPMLVFWNLPSSNNIDLWVYFFCFQLACLHVENWKLILLDFVKV